jgi:hypothetical protein
MIGGNGENVFFARNGKVDFITGGSGFNTAQIDNSSTVKDQATNIQRFLP